MEQRHSKIDAGSLFTMAWNPCSRSVEYAIDRASVFDARIRPQGWKISSLQVSDTSPLSCFLNGSIQEWRMAAMGRKSDTVCQIKSNSIQLRSRSRIMSRGFGNPSRFHGRVSKQLAVDRTTASLMLLGAQNTPPNSASLARSATDYY